MQVKKAGEIKGEEVAALKRREENERKHSNKGLLKRRSEREKMVLATEHTPPRRRARHRHVPTQVKKTAGEIKGDAGKRPIGESVRAQAREREEKPA
ncbi:hypothetical protein BJ546DRAFT_1062291 [Cryomyces antarcticus]